MLQKIQIDLSIPIIPFHNEAQVVREHFKVLRNFKQLKSD